MWYFCLSYSVNRKSLFPIPSKLWSPHGFPETSDHLAFCDIASPRDCRFTVFIIFQEELICEVWLESQEVSSSLWSFPVQKWHEFIYFITWLTSSILKATKMCATMRHLKMSLASLNDKLEEQHSFRWVLLYVSKIHCHSF